MAAAVLLIAAALLGHSKAGVIELNCSDNATCIENMSRDFVRSIRQQKTVRVFDMLTVEPLKKPVRQARSNEGPLARFLESHAFSFDWNDYTLRLWKAQDRSDAMDFEVYESRSAKDVSEEVTKKSKSKVEEEEEVEGDKKTPKGGIIKRRAKKKIIQAVIPLLFGMKSSAAIIFAMFLVTVLTLKAFVASKLALIVTVGMAVKRLYESYSLGVGFQNPYLYSQYPIDFPSASSHAYSVSGVSPQFPPEMYSPTAMGTHPQTELLQHNDASAQQSQQAPSVQLLNSTRAAERWDGKSKVLKLLEPIVDGIRSYIDPIANVFYSMPATFRGLNSDVTTMKTQTNEADEIKKPREILVPQPRFIAQRKTNFRKAYRGRPKKYSELKVDLDKLKKNKDLYDYVKTKKYKYNYPSTFYYPRIKHFINPSSFVVKPSNVRLVPYKKVNNTNVSINGNVGNTLATLDDWRPILIPKVNISNNTANFTHHPLLNVFGDKSVQSLDPVKRNKRVRRSINPKTFSKLGNRNSSTEVSKQDYGWIGRGFLDFIQTLMDEDPMAAMWKHANHYTKHALKGALKVEGPPQYYTILYDLLMLSLDAIDGLVHVHEAIHEHLFGGTKHKKVSHAHAHQHHHHSHQHGHKKKPAKKKKPIHGESTQLQNENLIEAHILEGDDEINKRKY